MRKKAVINPMNIDDDCFKWAILAKHVSVGHRNHVGKNYYNEEHRYDFSKLSSPTPISEIHIFERRNKGVSVNVYGLKPGKGGKVGKGEKDEKVGKESVVYPIRVIVNEKAEHFDLLVIEGSERMHYTYISNFSRLVRSQKTSHESRLFICKRCFTSFDEQVKKNKLRGNEALQQHMRLCGLNKPILPVMPEEGEVLGFNGWANMQRHPFAIYADFEALLEKHTERVGTSTDGIHAHHPMSYGYFVKAAVPIALMEKYDIPQVPVIYRGSESRDEVAKHFIASVTALAIRLGNPLKATNVPISMGVEELRVHNAKSVCDMCKLGFTETRWKVADHCHLSGRLRHTLCAPCNLKLTTPKFVPYFFHNLSKYDAHFIVTELGYDKESITVIPNTEENYISFSKRVMPDFSVRFLDSCRFMASSLAELAENLLTRPGDFEKFWETAKVFQPTDMPLVTRKGVFPYEYTDEWSKLEETALPPKHDFYSVLLEKHVSDEDYVHAMEVWRHFKCPNLGDYSDLYLKVDVLLLADVMENFRDLCMSTYNLDPVYYYTAPGFTFDAMLRYTGVKLELLIDYDMVLFVEQGIRGGLVQASERYCRANNPKTPGYDAEKPPSWLVYQDCKYTSQQLVRVRHGRIHTLRRVQVVRGRTLELLDGMTEKSNVGRVFEVDIAYPDNLHDAHNDLPFLPRNAVPPGSKVNKLMATLERKERYIFHYRNLKQAIANGLIVEKVHRVLEFQQSGWLVKYIDLNTEMRKKAGNAFERDFFKLLNNAVFGKTMECVRNRISIELVSCPRRMRKLINKPTFKHVTTYTENLAAVSLQMSDIRFFKPIYVGFAVLEISKELMYDYHYNVMRRHYNDSIRLLFPDLSNPYGGFLQGP
ncbi:C2H2-type domain-containing protein, partial [Aphis craccivora]